MYHRCKDTPLSVFIEFSDSGNNNALRRRLWASQKTLTIAAGILQMEFTALCGDKFSLPGKQIFKYRLLIAQLQELLNINGKSKKHQEWIKRKIYELTNEKNIDGAKRQLEIWKQHLAVEENLLKKAQKQSKNTGKNSFLDLVVETTKYMGIQIPHDTTTVAQFAGYVKSFKRHIENEQNRTRNALFKK